jgi:iron complex outermembrane recepter protein
LIDNDTGGFMLRSTQGLRASKLAIAVGSILAAASSVAADAPDTERQSEVVVTARKAPERLLDVPISISAFVTEDLAQSASRDLFDISSLAPGFTFERLNRYGVQGGVSRPVIRGMANVLGEGNAAVFIDGIPYSDSILSFPFELVDRIEIIKGPQAAMFGRSTGSSTSCTAAITRSTACTATHSTTRRSAARSRTTSTPLSSIDRAMFSAPR